MHAPDALMIFAAGFGTRMRPLTDTRPKPLVEVAGRALLDHALALAEGQGIARIAVNAHYLAGQIKAHLAGRSGIAVLEEQPLILDTGGGLKAARGVLGNGPAFTLNPDAVWTGPNPLATLRGAWDPARMDALVLVIPRGTASGHGGAGDFALDAAGRIGRGTDYVYTGAQVVATRRLDEIGDTAFSLNLLWDRLISEGRCHGVVHPGRWCDVGTAAAIPVAEALLRADADV
jgi:N-acetyl-alpha-D-muramate 1-phosphate uridylyltransferase